MTAGDVGFVGHPHLRLHQPGRGHCECPERLDAIEQALRQYKIDRQLVPVDFEPATVDQLTRVHEPAYVDLVQLVCQEGITSIGDADTGICPESHYVASLAAGGVLAACRQVLEGRLRRVFCAVRPPGHHAESDQARGFCLYNHVALAAACAITEYQLERVAIVDIDAHHGNGTQHTFERRRDVFYISLHERLESLPFPGTGRQSEKGIGPGEGYTLNIPLDRYCRWDDYERHLQRDVLPALHVYRPQLLLISCGFDTLASDPMANLSLQPANYDPLTRALVQLAEEHCHGRVISVLEGGYDLSNLGRAAVAHVRALVA